MVQLHLGGGGTVPRKEVSRASCLHAEEESAPEKSRLLPASKPLRLPLRGPFTPRNRGAIRAFKATKILPKNRPKIEPQNQKMWLYFQLLTGRLAAGQVVLKKAHFLRGFSAPFPACFLGDFSAHWSPACPACPAPVERSVTERSSACFFPSLSGSLSSFQARASSFQLKPHGHDDVGGT